MHRWLPEVVGKRCIGEFMMKKRQLKQIRRVLKLGLSLILMVSLSLGGWWLWPWQVREVRADTQPKTFTFETTAESFSGTAGSGDSTLSYDSGTGNPLGALKSRIYGRKSGPDANYWEWTGTWEDLGVPLGGTVTQIRVNAGYTRCTEYNVGVGFTVGPYELRENGGTLIATLWSGRSGTATDGSWVAIGAQSDQSVTVGNQASNTTIKLRLNNTLEVGNNASAAMTTYDDEVALVITYTAATTQLTQQDHEWFVTADSVALTDEWPSGARDLGETVAIGLPVANDLLVIGDKIRIQMNFSVSTVNLAASSKNFALQYVEADDCSTATDWSDVAAKSATSDPWRLFDESIGDSTPQENQIITSTAGAEGYYSEINPSGNNPNAVNTGQYSEWDWPVENYSASDGTTYCFRMVEGDGGRMVFSSYTDYPKLTTAPGTGNLLRHGDFFSKFTEQGFFWVD